MIVTENKTSIQVIIVREKEEHIFCYDDITTLNCLRNLPYL